MVLVVTAGVHRTEVGAPSLRVSVGRSAGVDDHAPRLPRVTITEEGEYLRHLLSALPDRSFVDGALDVASGVGHDARARERIAGELAIRAVRRVVRACAGEVVPGLVVVVR